MAPFVLPGDPVSLTVEDAPYAGVEVNVLTDIPLGVAAGIGRHMIAYTGAESGSAEEAEALRKAWSLFSTVLAGWNLWDRWGPIPADAAALSRISPRLVTTIIGLWADLMLPKAAEDA